jgi:hypothetical protein
MNAAAGTPGDEATREAARSFEQKAAADAESARAYTRVIRKQISELNEIAKIKWMAEAEAEMDDAEEEFDSLREVMEELDSMLNFDCTLQQGVADFESSGKELHGRETFRSLSKGSEGRARILRKAAQLTNRRFLRELQGIDRNPKYDGGYSEEQRQAKVLSREKVVVALWNDMVRTNQPIEPALGKRARSIAEKNGHTKKRKCRTSNIAKYQIGQPFNKGVLCGYIISIAPDTHGATSGPGALFVGASGPGTQTRDGQL